MKKGTKVLLMIGCAVLLVGTSIAGTMAYLTSKTEEVKNTFTVGKVEITLDESKCEVDGTKTVPNARSKGNEYKLVPGKTYVKDPVVHVEKGSEPCWVFVKVNNGLESVEVASLDDENIENQIKDKHWTKLTGSIDPAPGTGNVVYYKTVDASSALSDIDLPVFDKFKIKEDADSDDLAGATAVTLKAFAIQTSETFPIEGASNDNALLAWKAVGE